MQLDYIGPNKEEKLEKLPEDYDTPFSPPADVHSHVPTDYPTKDAGMDPTEWYQAGAAAASNTTFPKNAKRGHLPSGFVEE